MHTIRLTLLLTLAAVAAPTAADAAGIKIPDRCFREQTKIPVEGSGFTPNAAVDVGFANLRPVTRTTDGSGRFSAKVPVPDLGNAPVPGRARLFAVERGNTSNAASERVQMTPIAVGTRETSIVRVGEKIWVRFAGFPNGRVMWGHYLFGSKLRGKQRFGQTDGPCGTLRAHVALLPSFIDRTGIWTIQFDARKRYSRKTEPRRRAKINVTNVPHGARAAGGGAPLDSPFRAGTLAAGGPLL